MALDESVLQTADVGILRGQLHWLHRPVHSNDGIFALQEGETVLGIDRLQRPNRIGKKS